MKITQEVQDYAAQMGVTDTAKAIEIGLKDKAAEFKKAGAKIYRKE